MLLLIVVSLLPLQKATALRRGRELEGQLDAALADAARQRQLLERHPADEAAAAGLPAGQPASDVTFQLATLQQQLESLVQERSLAHLQQEQARMSICLQTIKEITDLVRHSSAAPSSISSPAGGLRAELSLPDRSTPGGFEDEEEGPLEVDEEAESRQVLQHGITVGTRTHAHRFRRLNGCVSTLPCPYTHPLRCSLLVDYAGDPLARILDANFYSLDGEGEGGDGSDSAPTPSPSAARHHHPRGGAPGEEPPPRRVLRSLSNADSLDASMERPPSTSSTLPLPRGAASRSAAADAPLCDSLSLAVHALEVGSPHEADAMCQYMATKGPLQSGVRASQQQQQQTKMPGYNNSRLRSSFLQRPLVTADDLFSGSAPPPRPTSSW